eukprot:TRINITY_DN6358_c0_g1_i2.p1 TRINITY_DN6358_c0_g1~~TRINITY_DN6358_c0_g1_i2.p1  ORF type:complete len:340 (-),score=34.30 TRINITY_DN6358_c0_g1_i2:396-1415(-)
MKAGTHVDEGVVESGAQDHAAHDLFIGDFKDQKLPSEEPSRQVFRVAGKLEVSLEDESSMDEFAAKVYSSELARGDFIVESHFLNVLQGHPNVAHIQAFCEAEPLTVITPLYMCDLRQYVHQDSGLDESRSAAVLSGTLKALQHVHGLQVMHRNIKPKHIAISCDPGVGSVLLDFSSACYTWDNFASQRQPGSLGYMAPEMLNEQKYGSAVDLFSVGCTMYFMFARRHPFLTRPFVAGAVQRRNAACQYTFCSRFDDHSDDCKHLITHLMMEDPAQRLSVNRALVHPWLATDGSGHVSCHVSCHVRNAASDGGESRARALSRDPAASSSCACGSLAGGN